MAETVSGYLDARASEVGAAQRRAGRQPMQTWTVAEDARLLHLRHVDQLKWVAIGADLHRSKTCVQARYCQLTPKKDRLRLFRRASWTAAAEAELEHLRYVNQLQIASIAKITGRTRFAVADKLELLKNGPRPRRTVQSQHTIQKFVPQSRLDDRARRMNGARSLTAELCGDPRVGQSALDKQNVAEPVRVDRRFAQLGPRPTLAGDLP